MFLLISFFLAQALPHHHAAPTPAPSPEVRITIVNAMSVPVISLNTSGATHHPTYPYFSQGTWTGNEAVKSTNMDCIVRDGKGLFVGEKKLSFQPVSSQVLLITGDLSTAWPSDALPQLGASPPPGLKPWTPNIQFHVYPCSTATNDLCRYRVVNAMPSKVLTLRASSSGNKAGQQLSLLAPGNSALLLHQPPNIHWEAEIDGKIYPFDMEQEDQRKNCLIPFFLRNGVPSFIRVFEDR
jgi:hypothetical protein